jgi:WD40 repeat protein
MTTKKLWIIPGILFLAVSCAVFYTADRPTADSGSSSLFDFVPVAKIGEPVIVPYYGLNVIKFSPDGKLLAYGGEGPPLAVVDARTRQILWNVPLSKSAAEYKPFGGKKIGGEPEINYWCSSISFSPDGSLLAVAGHGAGVLIYKSSSGEQIAHLDFKESDASAVSFSPDGKFLAVGMDTSGSYRNDNCNIAIAFYDCANWSLVNKTYYDDVSVKSILFASDGGKIFIAGYDAIHIFDTVKWRKIRSLKMKYCIEDTCISSDNTKILISAGGYESGLVEIWDVKEEPRLSKSISLKFPARLAPTRDFKYCLLGGGKEIHLLDLNTFKFVRDYQNIGDVGAVAFSPDEKTFAAGPFIFGSGEKKEWADKPAEDENDLKFEGHLPVFKTSNLNFISESAALNSHWGLKVHDKFGEINIESPKKARETNCGYILEKIKSIGENPEPMRTFFQENMIDKVAMWMGEVGLVPCYVDKIVVWDKPRWIIVCNWEYNSSHLIALYFRTYPADK